MKHLSQHFLESLHHKEVIQHQLDNNISINESYLRIDSEAFAETIVTKRHLFESGKYVPLNESEHTILENLNSGDKAIYVRKSGNSKEVKVDIPMPNPDRATDGKRFIVYRKSEKTDDNSGLPIARMIKFSSWATGLDINNDDDKASKSFFARHRCSLKTDKNTAGWWACYTPELFGDILKLRGGKNRW